VGPSSKRYATRVKRAISNPPNPWSTTHVDWLGEPPPVQVTVYEERARSIVVENDSPDVPFRWSVNPYRGCQHACAYCYARPYHQYIDLGAGTDFDSKIVVKTNAPELLRKALAKRSWKRELIAFSGVTDCYQPLEASYGLTRQCLEVCAEFAQPVGVITKGALVRRDIDILARIAKRASASVFLSIPFADQSIGRAIEPWASAVSTRFETMRRLSDAGITTGIAIAPMIPGLTDAYVPELLERAKAAGASRAFMTMLRLPAEVRGIFEERLRAALPLRADKVLNAVRDVRGGAMYRSQFGARMEGTGPRWEVVRQLFEVTCRRLGLDHERDDAMSPSSTASPTADARRDVQERQGLLF
jgi:DNA repair photolyase